MASSRKRFMKLAGMTASITGKVAKNSLKHLSRDEEKRLDARKQMLKDVGVQIADTLGEMKGAVMKVGQIASQYRDVFPAEVAEALEKLQKDAPPMPFKLIKEQLEKELGKPIDKLFSEFEQTPFASASIGQVHRAVLKSELTSEIVNAKENGMKNGMEVVVKVQYPNIEENIESDLSQIRLALKLTGVMNMSRELQEQIFQEIRDSLKEELDYQQEAKNLEKFANFHADDTGIIIPKVITSHSSKRILTLTREMGEPLAVAKTWDNDIKQQIAERLFRFSAGQLFQLQSLHCDPHPGNFAFRKDGSLIAYDFGGIRTYSDEQVALFRQFVRHATRSDVTAMEQDLIKMGIRKQDEVLIEGDFYFDWLAIGLKPLSIAPYYQGEFDFASSEVHHEVVTNMKKSLKYFNQFQPSPTTMMLDRTVTGQYWNLVSLGVSIDLSDLVEEYLLEES